MAIPGLVAANNLSDVIDREAAWTNLGRNISAIVPSGGGTATIVFDIKGGDILALNGLRALDVKDFIFIKGLSSFVQPRILTASQNTASGTLRQSQSMTKINPITTGDYIFQSPAALSGNSIQINGTLAKSIATSPFSGSVALYPIKLKELQPQANWRITETLTSGVIDNPEYAIPFETTNFILFMKAGQS